ncbi:MAG: sodium:solute symporter family protein, partial [Solirubrobacterales bacterium]|nr:sodium:solute symporter family protein [Solirubrobacterales bacterium]
GLAGRRFGAFISWFLLGGDLFTAYTFIAVPALVYGSGALGFFSVPYTIVVWPLVFFIMPRLWQAARRHGAVTPADFIRVRYGSSALALAIAVTGIIATMPYVALQLVGIQSVLQSMGLAGTGWQKDLPLIVAFAVLAAYTYTAGLRAPALIAFVKDGLIYAVVIVAVIAIPIKLGGFNHIFHAAQVQFSTPKAVKAGSAVIPGSGGQLSYATLALGSAFALFMYPHAITGVLSAKSTGVLKRNFALLPAYSLLLGLIALFGFMSIAAGVKVTNSNLAVPELFQRELPHWFDGIAFAAIAIGALVPAAIMSIAAANLFTRNIWVEYFDRDATPAREATVAKVVSLLVKLGAIVFVLLLSGQFSINLQLLGGVWILQTFPAIVFGLYTRWFHSWALLAGWLAGMVTGTLMAYAVPNPAKGQHHFGGSVYTWHYFGLHFKAYHGLIALVINLIVSVLATLLLRALRAPDGVDRTADPEPAAAGAAPPATT